MTSDGMGMQADWMAMRSDDAEVAAAGDEAPTRRAMIFSDMQVQYTGERK